MAKDITAIAQAREPIGDSRFQGTIKLRAKARLISASPYLIARARAILPH